MLCPLTHVLKSLVLLFLANISQQWTEMFSIRFWTFVTCRNYCSPARFRPDLPALTDHLGKDSLLQSSVSAQSLHPRTLSQAVNPISSAQPRGSGLFQLNHCGVWVVVIFFLLVPEHFQDKKIVFGSISPTPTLCHGCMRRSCKPNYLSICEENL